jgi:hypothetical protein
MFPTIQGFSSNGCKVGLDKRQREDHSDQHPKQDIRSYQRPTSHARSLSNQVEEEARVQRREEIELIACSCIRNV